MSFLTSWLVALFVRWMRKKKAGSLDCLVPESSSPDDNVSKDTENMEDAFVAAYNPPAWPRGARVEADMHDGRVRGDTLPHVLSISLRRDEKSGKIYDCTGRELVSVEIRGAGKRDFRSDSAGILQALSSEVLAGQMITLLLVDNAAFAESANSCRMGLHFIDATCVWVESAEGFGEVDVEAELAVA